MSTFTLTLSCPQRPGIVHAVTRFLFHHGCDIVEHQQFDDAVRGLLFLRTAFTCAGDPAQARLAEEFGAVAREFAMTFTIADERTPRVLVMVSRQGHCLNDLVFRWRSGTLGGDLAGVVSNHEDLRPMARAVHWHCENRILLNGLSGRLQVTPCRSWRAVAARQASEPTQLARGKRG